jgi:hypothetical protein
MVYVYAVVLTVLNLGFWVGMLFNQPGTWLMVLVTAMLKWWQPEYVLVSWPVLGVAAGLTVVRRLGICGRGGRCSKLRSRLGSGGGPVLGDASQARRRRHHCDHPGAGGILLIEGFQGKEPSWSAAWEPYLAPPLTNVPYRNNALSSL